MFLKSHRVEVILDLVHHHNVQTSKHMLTISESKTLNVSS